MNNDELIQRAIQYAKDNLNNNELTVQHVAEAAGFSLDYFNRLFFAHTGFTVMAYVGYARLKNAALLLRNSSKSITDIAMDTGYDSLEGFSRAFCKRYGIVPSEYRKKMKNRTVVYGDLADKAIEHRFIHEYPEFEIVETDNVIEYLMEKDARRFGWICSEILGMGLMLAAPEGKYEKGFIGVGDDLKGGYYLELFSDDIGVIAEWLERLDGKTAVHYMNSDLKAEEWLKKQGYRFECQEIAVYTGSTSDYTLPDSIAIRKLDADDMSSIMRWAGGKHDAYISHLLTEKHYSDDTVLEYGIFEGNELIAVAGCGLDEVGGVIMNESCIVRFAEGRERNELYKAVYLTVTDKMWQCGIVPYDAVQFGDYAKLHGGFCSTDIGFEIVNRKYRLTFH